VPYAFCVFNTALTTFTHSLTPSFNGMVQFCVVRTETMFNPNITSMKKIALTLFAFMLVACAFAQDVAVVSKATSLPSADVAVFKWILREFDFGKIKVSVPVSHEFTFTNTGDVPLVISSVNASCGCTVTAYSKDPIQPGGQGFVKATYNAAKVGQFTKTVTVNANTDEGQVVLTIKGEVIDPAIVE
jgi:hypothetical protein